MASCRGRCGNEEVTSEIVVLPPIGNGLAERSGTLRRGVYLMRCRLSEHDHPHLLDTNQQDRFMIRQVQGAKLASYLIERISGNGVIEMIRCGLVSRRPRARRGGGLAGLLSGHSGT